MGVGAHGIESFETRLRLGAAELGDIGHAVLTGLEAQRVRYSDRVNGRGKKVRPRSNRPANQNATRARACASQARWRRVLVVDQILGATDEVPPGIGFGGPFAR